MLVLRRHTKPAPTRTRVRRLSGAVSEEIPGGVAEHDESPLDACRREIREELGFELAIGDLLVVDWVPAHGVWFDGLMFIFDGGRVLGLLSETGGSSCSGQRLPWRGRSS